ncbi:MAG: hypothetical protein AB7I19_03725 [Planctomycetota bacterium]
MNEPTTKLSWSARKTLSLAMQIALLLLAYFLTGFAAVTTIVDLT